MGDFLDLFKVFDLTPQTDRIALEPQKHGIKLIALN